jgi:hypothetical protein
MVVQEKARVKDNGKDHMQDLVKSIVDTLWSYDSVKRVVNNNYVVLSAMVRNTIKSLGINADNFDYESFMDNFDVHVLDTNDKSTFIDSLSKLLGKFIVNKVDNNVDIAMEKAPYEVESRLREVMDYLRKNPQDTEIIDYAKELIQQLHGFNWLLASKYERELENIVNPKPKVEPEPKPVVRVIETEPVVDTNGVLKPVTESRLKHIRSYRELRPKLRELREETTRALEELRKQREAEIRSIEIVLFEVFRTLKDPRESKYWNENIELARSEIEKLRKLDPERADKYERELQQILSEIEKDREPKARVHVNRGKIIAYIPMPEKPRVNDVNAVDVSEILRPKPTKPRSVTNTKTVKRKPGLLRQIMNVIGKDFVNMYYYRSRSR